MLRFCMVARLASSPCHPQQRLRRSRVSLWTSRAIDAEDPHRRWRKQNLAEALLPIAGLGAGTRPAVTELFELVEAHQRHLELQRRPAVGPGQRNENAGFEALLAGRCEL